MTNIIKYLPVLALLSLGSCVVGIQQVRNESNNSEAELLLSSYEIFKSEVSDYWTVNDEVLEYIYGYDSNLDFSPDQFYTVHEGNTISPFTEDFFAKLKEFISLTVYEGHQKLLEQVCNILYVCQALPRSKALQSIKSLSRRALGTNDPKGF